MGFYVPWVIDGSRHSARLFRRTLQKEVGVGSGVDRPGDLKVQALNVPGTGFRVAPGGGVAQSRDSSATSRESYGPILDEQLIVSDVPGTGSQAARRDLVIVEITDPEMGSLVYPAPASPDGWQDGDNFVRVTVIPDVDSMVPAEQRPVKSLDQLKTGPYANVTGITLAAINWPVSTGTIAPAMIEDLRVLQRPWSVEVPLLSGAPSANQDLGAASWARWITPAEWPVDVPEQATYVDIRLDVLNAIHLEANNHGQIGCFADGVLAASGPFAAEWNGASTRQSTFAAARFAIPAAWRGTKRTFDLRARRLSAAGKLRADPQTQASLRLVFGSNVW